VTDRYAAVEAKVLSALDDYKVVDPEGDEETFADLVLDLLWKKLGCPDCRLDPVQRLAGTK
jgi:hypothetical protein